MTKILKIAKLELSVLFYSPIAWLVLTIFMVQCGIVFFNNLGNAEMSLASGYTVSAITRSIFSSIYIGLFGTVQSNLYLYLPILTMGLMSRETSSGSIKLLLSSPVKLGQIILGKYLAIITYGLFLMGVLVIYLLMAAISVKHMDVGLVLSGLLGIYLLICTYAAIGLFMSCLTNYQVVAAISTLAVFAVLKYVETIGQDVDFIRDLTYFLSISGRVENMINGLIITRDICYYVIIIASFLLLCVLLLKGQRELKPWPVKVARYVALLVAALLLGYISSRPALTGYLDSSADQAYTLSQNGQQVAAKFDDKLEVTTYVNLLAANLHVLKPAERNKDLSNMERYKRFIPGMEFHYVYYYAKPEDSLFSNYRFNPKLKGVTDIDSIAEETANSLALDKDLFIGPEQLSKQINLESEGFAAVRQLRYKGKSAFLRFFMDMNPYASEKEVMAALERLLEKAPNVIFVSSNNARSAASKGDRDYQFISSDKKERDALVNQGFNVDTINLVQQQIPDSTDILVLADPSVPFTEDEQKKIASYLEKGGNMIINGDPASRDILNPVLLPLGVQLKEGMLVTADREQSPGFINAEIGEEVMGQDTLFNNLFRRHSTVAMQGVAAIEQVRNLGYKTIPILTSPAGGWNRQEGVDPKLTTISLDPAKDQQAVFPVMMGLTRTVNDRAQRIIVSGDADFMSNGELSRQPLRGNNYAFTQGVFSWLCKGAFPFNPTEITPKDNALRVDRSQIKMLGWACKGGIPALIIALGGMVLLRRRRK